MQSKNISNVIISLVILAVGIKAIAIHAKSYIQTPAPGIPPEILGSLDSVGNLFVLGIAIIILILLPFYLSKRSEENKQKLENKVASS